MVFGEMHINRAFRKRPAVFENFLNIEPLGYRTYTQDKGKKKKERILLTMVLYFIGPW